MPHPRQPRPPHAWVMASRACANGLTLVPEITASGVTLKLDGAHKARKMFGERGRRVGVGRTALPGAGSRPSVVPPLGGQRVVVAFAALALAAKDKRGGQEQEGRGHQEQEPKSSKNAHDLRPMPDDRRPGVAQLVPAGAFVVMDQEEVIVQGLQAVPAEGVFAVLTHHLGAAFVPLNVHLAPGAALDGRVVPLQLEGRAAGLPGKEGDWHGLRAALAGVPAGFAGGAEFRVAGFALHQLRGLQPHLLQLAHGLAGGCWAPSPARVQEHLSFKL